MNKFIRLATIKEQKSETIKHRAMNSIPTLEGFEVVYMAWGKSGRGFYYSPTTLRCINLFRGY